MERIATLLAGALLTVAPAAQKPDAAAPVPPPTELGNAADRMTVPVSIGERGPFAFIVDTGAERSVISRELAAELGLDAGRPVRMTTLAGTAEASTVRVPALSVSTVGHHEIEAPALAQADLGATGVLGIDALQGHSVSLDFAAGTMTLTPAAKRKPDGWRKGDIVVRAKSIYGQLIVTNAWWRGKRIQVIVDTGSSVTVGNGAMRRLAGKAPRWLGRMGLFAADGARIEVDYAQLDDLVIGDVGFQNVVIAFADDAAPFARFGLGDTPALMLGMSTLRLFRRVQIDFANRQVRFSLPRGGIRTNICGSLNIRCDRYR